MLSGILELDGMAMAGCRVLLISADMTRLLASTTTDSNGLFVFTSLPESTVIVLAKIQGPALSISYRIIDLARHGPGPHRISIDSSGNLFHSIQGRIESTEGWPPYLLLHVDPVRLIGIPAALEKFFRTVDEHVIESSFFQQRVEGDSFHVRVQNGTYRIDTHYFNKWDEETPTYCLQQVKPDGEGTMRFEAPFESFPLNVDRDRQVHITIGPVKSDVQV